MSSTSSVSSLTKKQLVVAGIALAIGGTALTLAVLQWKKDNKNRRTSKNSSNSNGSENGKDKCANKPGVMSGETKRASSTQQQTDLLETILGHGLSCHDLSSPTVTVKSLESIPLIGIYFSAQWCGPCQEFTPKLATMYKAVRAVTNNKFQIVYASRYHLPFSHLLFTNTISNSSPCRSCSHSIYVKMVVNVW
jgi:thiol-disulfide isomerase/thioredoxin